MEEGGRESQVRRFRFHQAGHTNPYAGPAEGGHHPSTAALGANRTPSITSAPELSSPPNDHMATHNQIVLIDALFPAHSGGRAGRR
jgi:hypothetical protein